jgi:hypothetical protein
MTRFEAVLGTLMFLATFCLLIAVCIMAREAYYLPRTM